MSFAEDRQDGRLLVTVKEAAFRLSLSVRAFYREIAAGRFPQPLKIGRASRVAVADVNAYIGRLHDQRSARASAL